MTPKAKILSRYKLATSIATGATVIVLATGGSAIADSGSSSGASAAAAGQVMPPHAVNRAPRQTVGQIPADLKAGIDTSGTGTAANRTGAE
jgi:hypothetical protein